MKRALKTSQDIYPYTVSHMPNWSKSHPQTPSSSPLLSLPSALGTLPLQMHRNWGVQRGRGALGVYAPLLLMPHGLGAPLLVPPCLTCARHLCTWAWHHAAAACKRGKQHKRYAPSLLALTPNDSPGR